MIKKGDHVRFLNSVGGGTVTRIDEKKGLVYVEDEDGFEIPSLMHDCVVIDAINEKTNFPLKDFSSAKDKEEIEKLKVQSNASVKKPIPVVETEEGEELTILLAFFPINSKKLETTGYECHLVNDSNYYLFYNFIIGEKNNRRSAAIGVIEPNIQEYLNDVSKEDLNDWENLRIQIVAFKKDKSYNEQNVLDFVVKLNPVKFYKLHSFTETEYFDKPCMLINLTEITENKQLADINPEILRKAMLEKEEKKRPRFQPKKQLQEILEVDLHINQLLDTTAGMSNADILQYQMDVFHKTLEENKYHRGLKIVFIHGKGEGVLRSEIEKQLKTRYKNYSFQDASFREYGFGATMVTIR